MNNFLLYVLFMRHFISFKISQYSDNGSYYSDKGWKEAYLKLKNLEN